jgi:HKD family nuclease
MKTTLIGQGGAHSTSLSAELRSITENHSFDRLDVAVAYATLQGVKTLTFALGELPPVSRWVIGLDDAITQPEAIEHLIELDGAQVRLASLAPKRRFHPKIYRLWSSTQPELCVLALGSGNMTQNGLRYNGEAAALLASENVDEAKSLEGIWLEMWGLGVDATEVALTAYKAKHSAAKNERKKIAALGVAPPEPDADALAEQEIAFDGDPANAEVVWVDFGSAMGNGRELEFPKAVMPFFGVFDGTTTPQPRKFRFQNGYTMDILLVRRDNNGMWRIIFTQEVPNVEILKRPVLNGKKLRSTQAAYFKRAPNGNFEVRFFGLESANYLDLVDRSEQAGCKYRTVQGQTGKNYGFI